MKKLLFVTTALWVGGIERALIDLLWALAPDYELTVLLLRRELDLAAQLPPGCRLIVADRENYPFTRLHHLTEPPTAPSRLHRAFLWAVPALGWLEGRMFARYASGLAAGDYDRVVVFSLPAAQLLLRRFPKRKCILFYHHGQLPKSVRNWHRCEKIVAVSGPLAEQMREKFPKISEKVIEIPNLLAGERILRLAGEYDPGFSDETFHIVTVGRLHWDKGMDLAVGAAAILRNRGLDFRWYILGDGWEEQPLREKIKHYGLENKVMLTGVVENPYPYMKYADLYVQPSRVESYGLAMGEARVLGRPVIATDTFGARAQLPEDAICPVSAEMLAEKILQPHENPVTPESWDWQEENRENLAKIRQIL